MFFLKWNCWVLDEDPVQSGDKRRTPQRGGRVPKADLEAKDGRRSSQAGEAAQEKAQVGQSPRGPTGGRPALQLAEAWRSQQGTGPGLG